MPQYTWGVLFSTPDGAFQRWLVSLASQFLSNTRQAVLPGFLIVTLNVEGMHDISQVATVIICVLLHQETMDLWPQGR